MNRPVKGVDTRIAVTFNAGRTVEEARCHSILEYPARFMGVDLAAPTQDDGSAFAVMAVGPRDNDRHLLDVVRGSFDCEVIKGDVFAIIASIRARAKALENRQRLRNQKRSHRRPRGSTAERWPKECRHGSRLARAIEAPLWRGPRMDPLIIDDPCPTERTSW